MSNLHIQRSRANVKCHTINVFKWMKPIFLLTRSDKTNTHPKKSRWTNTSIARRYIFHSFIYNIMLINAALCKFSLKLPIVDADLNKWP